MQLGLNVSVGLPALGGIPFHYVAKGACALDLGNEQVAMRAGDFVMLARLPHYRLLSGDGTMLVEALDYAELDRFSLDDLRTGRDRLLRRDFGEGPIQARIFSAILMLGEGEGSPITRDLPSVTLLRDTGALLEPWLRAALDFVTADVQEPEPGLSAVAERLIETIFIAVLRKWLIDGAHERGWMRGLTDPTISRVLNAMHLDPGRRWTLRELALASGRSRSGLAAHFHEIMGETPFAYLTRWRMDLAATALARGERSIAGLGVRLGYGSASALSRTFLATFGETPAQYRRRTRG